MAEQGAASDTLEGELMRIWCELLQLERVGRLDDFYDLGGHPALLMHMGSAIRETFGVDVPQRLLFDGTTVASLSVIVAVSLIEQLQRADPAAAGRLLDDVERLPAPGTPG